MRTALILTLGAVMLAGQTQKGGITQSTAPSFVGVMVQEIDGNRARTLKLPEEAGVEVTRIEPDSPAEHAGLRVGDVVLHYNGQRVEGMEEFSRLVRETPLGREVKLEIYRGGSPMTIALRVSTRHMTQPSEPQRLQLEVHQYPATLPDLPRSFLTWRIALLGIDAEALEGQLAQYFGVKDGALVRSVTRDSPADRAGIKAGDVILRVDDTRVETPADISMLLRANKGVTAAIVAMRDHREVRLKVALENSGGPNLR